MFFFFFEATITVEEKRDSLQSIRRRFVLRRTRSIVAIPFVMIRVIAS